MNGRYLVPRDSTDPAKKPSKEDRNHVEQYSPRAAGRWKGQPSMSTTRTLALVALGLVLFTQPLRGQDRSRYRDFQLGSDLPSVSALASVAPSEARTIHQRPAVMQELLWRPPYFVSGSTAPQHDPVRQIVFSFFDDQLSKMVVDYDQVRTAGLTDADMINAISTAYGAALKPGLKKIRPVASQLEQESGTPLAQWGDADYSVVLYRSAYASEFRIVVTSPRLEALARTADAQAIRLDEREAPQREIARQKKEVEDTRVSEEKARVANKAAFRP
jgi:hypothetical protein